MEHTSPVLSQTTNTRRIELGQILEGLRLEGIRGSDSSEARIAIPDAERVVHLQFRRFAGCPICTPFEVHREATRRTRRRGHP